MSFLVHHPASLPDAVALGQKFGETGRFIAGGTDLIIQINRGRLSPGHLIDLNTLTELSGIDETADSFTIGALTTHKQVERHPAFQDRLLGLAEAARVVGGHQVRNMGTVGGNIANASPAADVVAPLLTLDAAVTLLGPDGERTMPLTDFLLGPGRTARREGEILRHVSFARPAARSATAFLKAGRRKAMEISVVCVAASLSLTPDGACANARIALGAVNAVAMRANDAELALRGVPVTDDAFREAGRLAAAACKSHRRRAGIRTLPPLAGRGAGAACLASVRAADRGEQAMKRVPLTLTINGEQHELLIEPHWTLLHVLRTHIGLAGSKENCLEAECGVCTVLLDGKAVNSCILLAELCRGRRIVTIEGLGDPEHLHPLQDAFIKHGAIQCGYCIPGMILTAKSFLDENPGRVSSSDEIREAICGTLCRCTGYQKIVDAIAAVATERARKGREADAR